MKGKYHWHVKIKRYVTDTLKQGYVMKEKRELYSNMKIVKSDSP